jgi:hypothetical protein
VVQWVKEEQEQQQQQKNKIESDVYLADDKWGR